MDIPDLVQRALGGEEIRTGVSLGDEDVVCFTPTRTLVYNGEGLLSDEGVEEFPLDTERLSIKRSRRKTKFVLQYIEGPQSFTVPATRGEEVLERLLEGILRREGVIDPEESVAGVYLFSELTLAITGERVVKHIGGAVWDEDFEVYDFADVTGLDFEETSVATSIVVGIDGHPQRVKVPNDNAPLVRRTLQEALFDFHDVSSLDELNRVLGEGDEVDVDQSSSADDLTFGSGIDPLVTDRDDDPAKGVEDPFATGPTSGEADDIDATPGETVDAVGTPDTSGPAASSDSSASPSDGATADASTDAGEETQSEAGVDASTETETETGDDPLSTDRDPSGQAESGTDDPAGESDRPGSQRQTPGERADDDDGSDPESGASESPESTGSASDGSPTDTATGTGTGAETEATAVPAADAETPADVATSEDVAVVADRLEELTDAVDRQNELLKRQHRAMKQLVERLGEE